MRRYTYEEGKGATVSIATEVAHACFYGISKYLDRAVQLGVYRSTWRASPPRLYHRRINKTNPDGAGEKTAAATGASLAASPPFGDCARQPLAIFEARRKRFCLHLPPALVGRLNGSYLQRDSSVSSPLPPPLPELYSIRL